MSDEMSTPAGATRRGVLRTAAHAAWIAPAITVVAAAPAMAAAASGANLTATPVAQPRLPQDEIVDVVTTVTNAGAASPGLVTVVATMAASQGTLKAYLAVLPADGSSPWTLTGSHLTSDAKTLSGTFVSSSVTGASGSSPTSTLKFEFGVLGATAGIPVVSAGSIMTTVSGATSGPGTSGTTVWS